MIRIQTPRSWERPALRPLTFAAVALLVVMGSYLAAGLAPRPPQTPPVPPPGARSVEIPAPAPAAGGSAQLLAAVDHEIGLWSASLDANEGNFIAAGMLGTLYLQRGRLTGDLADYGRALEAADRSIEADPIFWSGHTVRASALFAMHDFNGARDEARAAYAADPSQLDALAVIGDASLELGDLAAAEDAYRRLGEVASSPPVWSRLAHLAFIRGEADRALELVSQSVAATEGEGNAAGAAFYRYQLGELHRTRGDLSGAEAAYADALSLLPDYVPATSGLARVREAQGRRTEAISMLEAAAARLPQPELVAALGDLYALAGDLATAERQYALVDRIGELGAATGSAYDRQLVLFAADHDRGLADAVALARAELAVRADIYAHDALAWALFKVGQLEEAASEAAAALALGTPDPRLLYHAGLIAAAQGRTDAARSLLEAASAGAAYLPPLQLARLEAALAALAAPELAP